MRLYKVFKRLLKVHDQDIAAIVHRHVVGLLELATANHLEFNTVQGQHMDLAPQHLISQSIDSIDQLSVINH